MEQFRVFTWNLELIPGEEHFVISSCHVEQNGAHQHISSEEEHFEQLPVSAPITRSLELTVTRSPTIFTANVLLFSFAAASVD